LIIKAPVHLPGEQRLAEHRLSNVWYAVGLTTTTPGAFQGRHHPRLLVVLDEAANVPELIHLEISTLATGDENCILMIGNPTSTSGTFYESHKKHSDWRKFHISCLDHPNVVKGREIIKGAVTRGWVAKRRKEWGEQHPFWFSRVLGEFPMISTRGVIPLAWVERQTNEEKRLEALEKALEERMPIIAGLDVARYGENKSVLTLRRGDAIMEIRSWHHKSLMETTGLAKKAMEEDGISLLIVDASGIGAGVVDRLLEQNMEVYAYNGGHRAFSPKTFTNRRSEMWWLLRERFEKGLIWLPDTKTPLLSDLIAPQYEIASSGRLKVETKELLLKRGVPSPDFADSLSLCFAADEDPFVLPPEQPGPNQDITAFEQDHGTVDDFPSLPIGF
jgi:hypothetical protein